MMRFMASMTALLSNPSARLVGIFSAVAAILLAAGAFIWIVTAWWGDRTAKRGVA